MSFLNQTVLYGSLSISEKTLEGSYTDETKSDDEVAALPHAISGSYPSRKSLNLEQYTSQV